MSLLPIKSSSPKFPLSISKCTFQYSDLSDQLKMHGIFPYKYTQLYYDICYLFASSFPFSSNRVTRTRYATINAPVVVSVIVERSHFAILPFFASTFHPHMNIYMYIDDKVRMPYANKPIRIHLCQMFVSADVAENDMLPVEAIIHSPYLTQNIHTAPNSHLYDDLQILSPIFHFKICSSHTEN